MKTSQCILGHEQSTGQTEKQNVSRLIQRWFAVPPTSGWALILFILIQKFSIENEFVAGKYILNLL